MLPTDAKTSAVPDRRKRLWIAVAIAFVLVAAIVIAFEVFTDFTRGFRDGLDGRTAPQTTAPR